MLWEPRYTTTGTFTTTIYLYSWYYSLHGATISCIILDCSAQGSQFNTCVALNNLLLPTSTTDIIPSVCLWRNNKLYYIGLFSTRLSIQYMCPKQFTTHFVLLNTCGGWDHISCFWHHIWCFCYNARHTLFFCHGDARKPVENGSRNIYLSRIRTLFIYVLVCRHYLAKSMWTRIKIIPICTVIVKDLISKPWALICCYISPLSSGKAFHKIFGCRLQGICFHSAAGALVRSSTSVGQ